MNEIIKKDYQFIYTKEELEKLNLIQLEDLATHIREKIIDVVGKSGGHLSSNLEAVELTIAMYTVFDSGVNPLIFDVSHQSYTRGLLSGKKSVSESLRQFDELSGYTKPNDGDYFIARHSSASISLAVGAYKAIALEGEKRTPVVLVGDGALSAGMAYEALNELGDPKFPCVVVLNDNEMSISKPIGVISEYPSQTMTTQFCQNFKKRVAKILDTLPDSATYMAKCFEESFKLITPRLLFGELGLEHIGPIDGRSLSEVISALKQAEAIQKPRIVHAQILKGKGYSLAGGKDARWHGVNVFDVDNGESIKKNDTKKSATETFSRNLLDLVSKYRNIVGVTTTMSSGASPDKLIEKYPNRFWGVGIAEQHAVTSVAVMARERFKPFIAIYSTFLQRTYDRVIHDCAIMNLNVVFAMDRADIVGEGGGTHQGASDVNFLTPSPDLTLIAPRGELMMKSIMEYAYTHEGRLAFRYPRGSFISGEEFNPTKIELGKAQWLVENQSNIAFSGYRQGMGKIWEILRKLQDEGQSANLIDLIFTKPLDKLLLRELAKQSQIWFVFGESARIGGVTSLLESFVQENDLKIKIVSFKYEGSSIEHDKASEVEKVLKLDIDGLVQRVKIN